VKWWSDELSQKQYDGIIGLSQGSAMTALLISMVTATTLPNLILDKNLMRYIHSSIIPNGFPASTLRRLSLSSLPYSALVRLVC
jgi:hypothetical protein